MKYEYWYSQITPILLHLLNLTLQIKYQNLSFIVIDLEFFLWYIVQDAKKSVRFHAWPQTNLLFMRRWSNFTIAKIIWMLEGFTRRSGVLCGLFALYMRLYRICVITSCWFLFHFFVERFSKWNFILLPEEQTVRAGLSHLLM